MKFLPLKKSIFFLFLLSTNISLFATNYYISNNGDDENLGTSSTAAWQTINKINSISLSAGDTVFFEANSVWRETLLVTESGTPGNNIVYTRYGTGANPKILGSEMAENWTLTGTPNVWESGTALDNYSDEYNSGRIFFVENDSVSWGQYQGPNAALTSLDEEYQYTISGTTYYVFSVNNPNTKYDRIEVTQRSRCISIPDGTMQSYLEFNGIDLQFPRLAGFDAGYPAERGATDLIFRNCTVGYVGAQPSNFGYGIAAWHSNFLAENNTITDCGRRGISINLYLQMDPGQERNLNNIIIRNNVFKRGYHTTALDLSSQQTSTDTIQNIYFYNNIVDDSDFENICSGCGSNQVFFQDGSDESYLNNIYVIGNIFIQSTARNILFEGVDTSYVWYNTIVGHNPNITENPYNNVAWNSDEAVAYYQNNILYDNLPDNNMQNHGVFIYKDFTGIFGEKDYNLYYSLFPKNDRNFSAHLVNSTGGMGYWRTTEWNDYLTENTLFEQHSPAPENPNFIDYNTKNYQLTDTSAAREAGIYLTKIITDPFGQVDTLGKYDFIGKPRIIENPSIGAFEYADPDSTAANIVLFTLPQQKGSATIDTNNHTVQIDVIYGTSLTSLSPQITTSYGATIDPLSGVARDFTTPQQYTVTSLNKSNQITWTVSVSVAPSSQAAILSFTLPEQTGDAIINNETNSIQINVDPLSNLTNLTPTISISENASINPSSGIEQDFSSPVQYTVTAQDGVSQRVWTVTVNHAPSNGIQNKSQENKVMIYPNPASKACNIVVENPYSSTYKVKVFNSMGQNIYSTNRLNEKEHKLQTKDFTPGMYQIQIIFENGTILTQNLIITKSDY